MLSVGLSWSLLQGCSKLFEGEENNGWKILEPCVD